MIKKRSAAGLSTDERSKEALTQQLCELKGRVLDKSKQLRRAAVSKASYMLSEAPESKKFVGGFVTPHADHSATLRQQGHDPKHFTHFVTTDAGGNQKFEPYKPGLGIFIALDASFSDMARYAIEDPPDSTFVDALIDSEHVEHVVASRPDQHNGDDNYKKKLSELMLCTPNKYTSGSATDLLKENNSHTPVKGKYITGQCYQVPMTFMLTNEKYLEAHGIDEEPTLVKVTVDHVVYRYHLAPSKPEDHLTKYVRIEGDSSIPISKSNGEDYRTLHPQTQVLKFERKKASDTFELQGPADLETLVKSEGPAKENPEGKTWFQIEVNALIRKGAYQEKPGDSPETVLSLRQQLHEKALEQAIERLMKTLPTITLADEMDDQSPSTPAEQSDPHLVGRCIQLEKDIERLQQLLNAHQHQLDTLVTDMQNLRDAFEVTRPFSESQTGNPNVTLLRQFERGLENELSVLSNSALKKYYKADNWTEGLPETFAEASARIAAAYGGVLGVLALGASWVLSKRHGDKQLKIQDALHRIEDLFEMNAQSLSRVITKALFDPAQPDSLHTHLNLLTHTKQKKIIKHIVDTIKKGQLELLFDQVPSNPNPNPNKVLPLARSFKTAIRDMLTRPSKSTHCSVQ